LWALRSLLARNAFGRGALGNTGCPLSAEPNNGFALFVVRL
jgi:hypothetical protein